MSSAKATPPTQMSAGKVRAAPQDVRIEFAELRIKDFLNYIARLPSTQIACSKIFSKQHLSAARSLWVENSPEASPLCSKVALTDLVEDPVEASPDHSGGHVTWQHHDTLILLRNGGMAPLHSDMLAQWCDSTAGGLHNCANDYGTVVL